MTDYIEREAALDIVNGWREQLIPTYGENDEYVKCLETVAEHLESLHAADVRPVVRAYWKSVPHKRARVCSRCEADEPYKFADDDANVYNFCPNCGADMREVE